MNVVQETKNLYLQFVNIIISISGGIYFVFFFRNGKQFKFKIKPVQNFHLGTHNNVLNTDGGPKSLNIRIYYTKGVTMMTTIYSERFRGLFVHSPIAISLHFRLVHVIAFFI